MLTREQLDYLTDKLNRAEYTAINTVYRKIQRKNMPLGIPQDPHDLHPLFVDKRLLEPTEEVKKAYDVLVKYYAKIKQKYNNNAKKYAELEAKTYKEYGVAEKQIKKKFKEMKESLLFTNSEDILEKVNIFLALPLEELYEEKETNKKKSTRGN